MMTKYENMKYENKRLCGSDPRIAGRVGAMI